MGRSGRSRFCLSCVHLVENVHEPHEHFRHVFELADGNVYASAVVDKADNVAYLTDAKAVFELHHPVVFYIELAASQRPIWPKLLWFV